VLGPINVVLHERHNSPINSRKSFFREIFAP